MTVEELIGRLLPYPPYWPVVLDINGDGGTIDTVAPRQWAAGGVASVELVIGSEG